jgi:hypothetical protein
MEMSEDRLLTLYLFFGFDGAIATIIALTSIFWIGACVYGNWVYLRGREKELLVFFRAYAKKPGFYEKTRFLASGA